MNILGFDIGEQRIGVAIGSDETHIASPLGIFDAKPEEKCFLQLLILLQQESIGKCVIGFPRLLNHRSQETEQQHRIRAWAERFRAFSGQEILFEDETLSTALAERWQHEQGGRGKRDDLAATVILQSYLDRYECLSS